MKELLTSEQDDLTKARALEFLKPTWHPETKVGKILSALSDKAKLAPLGELAKLSSEEMERHRRLTEDLAKDPLKAVAEQEAAAQAVRRLRLTLQQVGTSNAEARLKDVKSKADDVRTKRAAAKLAAEAAFSDDLLPGVRGDAWRVLWISAKTYAETEAYVGRAFPTEDADARCVLCQQDLDKDARARMHNFQKFVEADTEKLAVAAEKTFSQTVQAFKAAAISGKQTAADRRQVSLRDATLGRNTLRYLASIRLRRRKCIAALSGSVELALPDLAPDPANDLRKLEEDLTTYAAELKTAADVEGRKKLQLECDELSDRIALSFLQGIAKEEVDRLKKLKMVGDCLKDTATAAITNLGNDIADSAITPQIRDRFQQEIVQLAGNRIRVEIVRSGGKFGSPQYQVRLFANPQAKVHTVLSEGEQTCVALAAFLTELATATHASSLVFDDPVSSLDHRWRKQVANRLVSEAKVRQIIVFTHDIVFVNDLLDKALELKVPHAAVTVAKGTEQVPFHKDCLGLQQKLRIVWISSKRRPEKRGRPMMQTMTTGLARLKGLSFARRNGNSARVAKLAHAWLCQAEFRTALQSLMIIVLRSIDPLADELISSARWHGVNQMSQRDVFRGGNPTHVNATSSNYV